MLNNVENVQKAFGTTNTEIEVVAHGKGLGLVPGCHCTSNPKGFSFFRMTRQLRRYHHSGQSHFITFSCYRREAYFNSATRYDLFVACLEEMRRRFSMCIYGYVVMPEHVYLLVSEPDRENLADAIHFLKLSFANSTSGRGISWASISGRADTGFPRSVDVFPRLL